IETGNEIEERGLACPVRTYDAEDFIASKRQADVLQCLEAAEADTETLDFEKRVVFRTFSTLQRCRQQVMLRDPLARRVAGLGRQHADEALPDESHDSIRKKNEE